MMELQENKILVSGASGYIGSYFIENYSDKNFKIIPLVLTLPNHFKYWKEKFDVIECDITKLSQLRKRIPKIDCIIHLAALNEVLSQDYPRKALIVNGIGTRNMLEIAKEKGCKFFIFFSTLQVYGKELEGIIDIKSPIILQNDYALTHYVAEQYCKIFSTDFDMNIAILRGSNIFGTPVNINVDRWSLVPACFCSSAYRTNKIVLKSSGKQVRDFIDLGFVLKSLDYLLKNIKKGLNIYNITSETTFSILEIAKIVQSVALSELNQEIAIINESEFPLISNNFKAINNLLVPDNKELIKAKLACEIKKIFKLLKKDLELS